MPSFRMHLTWKEAFQKSSFLLGFNVISNKNHLSYSYIVFRNGKVLRIEKNWKNTNKVHFNVLHRKSYRTKKSRLLVSWCKYIGNCQSYFNFQGCEFHDLTTVRDCSYLTSTSFLSKLTSSPSPINFCRLFTKSLSIVDVSFSKLILPLKKEKQKQKQQHQQQQKQNQNH